jgi:hypothetical protein
MRSSVQQPILTDKNVMARARKYYLKNNYLTQWRDIKAGSRTLYSYRFYFFCNPICQNLSKALLISQNTTLISFPSSKAFPNSLVINKSWLIAESPLVMPDWCEVMIQFTCPIIFHYPQVYFPLSGICKCNTGIQKGFPCNVKNHRPI